MNGIQRRKAESILIIITIIWGGTFVVIKGALDDTSPLFFVGARFAIATVYFLPESIYVIISTSHLH